MLKTICVCGIFFVSSAYAVEQKVYSASELEKIAEEQGYKFVNFKNEYSIELLNF